MGINTNMGNGSKSLYELSFKNIIWMILIYVELLLIALRDNLLSYIAKNWDQVILILDTISNTDLMIIFFFTKKSRDFLCFHSHLTLKYFFIF